MVKIISFKETIFFFNLSGRVGKGKANALDDVEFVRFGYKMMAQNKKRPTQGIATLLPAIQRLRPNGGFGDDLDELIVLHEKVKGGTQDRCISPMVNITSNGGSYDLKNPWIVLQLNNHMALVTGDLFPRIDLHPDSGPEVTKTVAAMFERT